jgi:hypothetical protein
MFTALIRAGSDPMAMTATMGPLVRGVVEGLVGTAILITPQPSRVLDEIADAAGARLFVVPSWPEGFARAVAASNGGGLLVIEAGLMLGQDFWPLIADMAPFLGDRPAVTHAPANTGFEALLDLIRRPIRVMRGVPRRDQAILMPGAVAREIARKKEDPFLHAYGRSLVTLPSVAIRVGHVRG